MCCCRGTRCIQSHNQAKPLSLFASVLKLYYTASAHRIRPELALICLEKQNNKKKQQQQNTGLIVYLQRRINIIKYSTRALTTAQRAEAAAESRNPSTRMMKLFCDIRPSTRSVRAQQVSLLHHACMEPREETLPRESLRLSIRCACDWFLTVHFHSDVSSHRRDASSNISASRAPREGTLGYRRITNRSSSSDFLNYQFRPCIAIFHYCCPAVYQMSRSRSQRDRSQMLARARVQEQLQQLPL